MSPHNLSKYKLGLVNVMSISIMLTQQLMLSIIVFARVRTCHVVCICIRVKLCKGGLND